MSARFPTYLRLSPRQGRSAATHVLALLRQGCPLSLIRSHSSAFRPPDKAMVLRAVTSQWGSPDAFNTALRMQLMLEPMSYRWAAVLLPYS